MGQSMVPPTQTFSNRSSRVSRKSYSSSSLRSNSLLNSKHNSIFPDKNDLQNNFSLNKQPTNNFQSSQITIEPEVCLLNSDFFEKQTQNQIHTKNKPKRVKQNSVKIDPSVLEYDLLRNQSNLMSKQKQGLKEFMVQGESQIQSPVFKELQIDVQNNESYFQKGSTTQQAQYINDLTISFSKQKNIFANPISQNKLENSNQKSFDLLNLIEENQPESNQNQMSQISVMKSLCLDEQNDESSNNQRLLLKGNNPHRIQAKIESQSFNDYDLNIKDNHIFQKKSDTKQVPAHQTLTRFQRKLFKLPTHLEMLKEKLAAKMINSTFLKEKSFSANSLSNSRNLRHSNTEFISEKNTSQLINSRESMKMHQILHIHENSIKVNEKSQRSKKIPNLSKVKLIDIKINGSNLLPSEPQKIKVVITNTPQIESKAKKLVSKQLYVFSTSNTYICHNQVAPSKTTHQAPNMRRVKPENHKVLNNEINKISIKQIIKKQHFNVKNQKRNVNHNNNVESNSTDCLFNSNLIRFSEIEENCTQNNHHWNNYSQVQGSHQTAKEIYPETKKVNQLIALNQYDFYDENTKNSKSKLKRLTNELGSRSNKFQTYRSNNSRLSHQASASQLSNKYKSKEVNDQYEYNSGDELTQPQHSGYQKMNKTAIHYHELLNQFQEYMLPPTFQTLDTIPSIQSHAFKNQKNRKVLKYKSEEKNYKTGNITQIHSKASQILIF